MSNKPKTPTDAKRNEKPKTPEKREEKPKTPENNQEKPKTPDTKDKKVDPKGKDIKKENIDEIKKEEETEVTKAQTMENEGFGRFEYRNGARYEGHWKIINGVKMKHGEGTLIHPGSTSLEQTHEEYRGSWVEDKMNGTGVYKYTSGAAYTGEWLDNKHHGKGRYEFTDGSIYEGEWYNHKMNGTGCFIDRDGNKWEGKKYFGLLFTYLWNNL